MFKNYINNFLFSITFLLITNEAFLVFGTIGRTFVLAIGLLNLIVFIGKNLNKINKSLVVKLFFTYVILILISFFNSQKNINNINFIFQLISIVLIIFGSLENCKLDFVNLNETKWLSIFFLIIFLYSGFKFLLLFNNLTIASTALKSNSRNTGDDSLNPIGVAYNHACLFLIFMWVFFKMEVKYLKILFFFLSIYSISIVLFTLSRGVLIYLSLIIFFIFISRFTFKKINLKSIIYTTYIFLIFFLLNNINFIKIRIYFLLSRFDSLFSFVSHKSFDPSSYERQLNYKYFFNHFDEMIFGMYKYSNYPHNVFLEILMRWGIFGFILIYIILYTFFKSLKISFSTQTNKFSFLISILFIYSFLQSTTSLSLEMNKLLWYSIGFLILFKRESLEKDFVSKQRIPTL